MRATDAYGSLVDFGQPVVETREAAARLGVSLSAASRTLSTLAEGNLVRRLRRGVWAIDPSISPLVAAAYLTAPYPAYVSLWSALAEHGMIEQIPRSTYVVSLQRTAVLETPLGPFSIHHLAPEVFTGFDGTPETGYLATPEKALFDTVYIRAPRGGRAHFPELELPAGFDAERLDGWVGRIERPRLRTIVREGIEATLAS